MNIVSQLQSIISKRFPSVKVAIARSESWGCNDNFWMFYGSKNYAAAKSALIAIKRVKPEAKLSEHEKYFAITF